MSKVCDSKSSEALEPLAKVETAKTDGPQKIGCHKLQCLLTCLSTWPIYALIFWVSSIEKCFASHDPITTSILVGMFATLEALHLMIFAPPKTYGQSYIQLEMVDFEELEKEKMRIGVMRINQRIHGFSTLCTIWSVAIAGIYTARNQLPYVHYHIVAFIFLLLGFLATCGVYRAYSVGRWMSRYSTSTINCSIFFQTIGYILLVQGCLQRISFSLILLGASIVLGTVVHLRFAFYFKNPPQYLSVVSIKSTRPFLKNWYGWMLLGNCVIWVGLFLIGPLTSGTCSTTTVILLLAFCIATPLLMIWKIFFACWKSRAMKEKLVNV
ncbi:hypothetical protein CRE_20017 [Caenorhabditis remanei]|uniref:Uncharacterized protein n=1 Tax=Caenorhabditis remanei TaxID=31234 RepID=E3NCG3_CAERE|nr:hypothetical protein CRE_20017 [Caenorhabditis remanei]